MALTGVTSVIDNANRHIQTESGLKFVQFDLVVGDVSVDYANGLNLELIKGLLGIGEIWTVLMPSLRTTADALRVGLIGHYDHTTKKLRFYRDALAPAANNPLDEIIDTDAFFVDGDKCSGIIVGI